MGFYCSEIFAVHLEAFLDFVPDGEYTFIICGALTLIFNVNAIFTQNLVIPKNSSLMTWNK
jgi:hypothetical protein